MNATSIIKDLQYIIDKKNRYLQRCKEAEKDCKALEIELAILTQAKELLEDLLIKQQDLAKQVEKTEKYKKYERIAKGVWCQLNSEIWWGRGDFTYMRKLQRIYNRPEAAISEWKSIVQSMNVDEREAEALENRLNYYDPLHYDFYKNYLKDCFTDIKTREKQWREKTDKRIAAQNTIKTLENHA